jgi:hypothetical protein
MMAKCVVCGRFYQPGRSRTYCDPHYWRVWRLQQKSRVELERVLATVEDKKACVEAALAPPEDDAGAVARSQP